MSSDVLQLRPSGLPLALICGGSVRPSQLAINSTNDSAELGTATHKCLAELVRTGRVDWPGVEELALEHSFNVKEFRAQVAAGAKLWWRVCDSFPDAEPEQPLSHRGEGYVLKGTVDVLARTRRTARVADWKGGRLDKSYREQLLGYAALALFNDPDLDEAEGGILWIRDEDFEPYALRRNQLEAWEQRLIEKVVRWDGTYRPGPHCPDCPRRHECPAASALARHDVAAIRDVDFDAAAIDALTKEQTVELLVLAREVEKKAKRVIACIRQGVLDHGDVVGEGQRLTIKVDEERTVDVLEAYPILEEFWGFDEADMRQVLRLNLSDAETIIRERAPARKGQDHVRQFRAQLDAAGAIRTSEVVKLVVRRN